LYFSQERGLHLDEDFDIDEETRFSSVYRGEHVDDTYEEDEDILFDSHNSETFCGIFGSVDERYGEIIGGEGNGGAHTLANSSFMVYPHIIIYLSKVLVFSNSQPFSKPFLCFLAV
jgi:hypothetical protein